MKIIKLNGEVINIGEWDYKLHPVNDPTLFTQERVGEIKKGNDPLYRYYESTKMVMEVGNPLPEGAVEDEAEITVAEDGGRYVSTDYRGLRRYDTVEDQLDYIFHNGIDAWKRDMIQPVKDAHPKV